MSKYLAPLVVFVGGNLFLLIAWLLLPTIGQEGAVVGAKAAGYGNLFWGMSWAASSVKLIVVVLGELAVLFITFRAFLSARD